MAFENVPTILIKATELRNISRSGLENVDGSTVNTIDSTGAETIATLARDLSRQNVRLGLAGFRTEMRCMLERAGAMAAVGIDSVFPTLESAAE